MKRPKFKKATQNSRGKDTKRPQTLPGKPITVHLTVDLFSSNTHRNGKTGKGKKNGNGKDKMKSKSISFRNLDMQFSSEI